MNFYEKVRDQRICDQARQFNYSAEYICFMKGAGYLESSVIDLWNWAIHRMGEVFPSLACRNQSPLLAIQPGKSQLSLRLVNGWIARPFA